MKNITDLQGRSLPKRWTEGRFTMNRLEPPTLREITAEKKEYRIYINFRSACEMICSTVRDLSICETAFIASLR